MNGHFNLSFLAC